MFVYKIINSYKENVTEQAPIMKKIEELEELETYK